MKQRIVSLKDISNRIQYGYTASAVDEEIGPRYLRITDIVPDQIDWERVPYCEIDETEIEKYLLRPGDIVVARTGNTTGYAKLIRDEKGAVFASYLVRFQLDKSLADPGFVGRLVESDIYKRFVAGQKGGAAQGNANAQTLALFPIQLPELALQRRIASILAAYDESIKNNLRRIKLLEDSARLLYNEWFVHLRFPGHEHTRIVKGVPEGWEKASLGNVCGSIMDGDWIESKDQGEGDFRLVQISNIGMNEFVETENYRFISEETFKRLRCTEIQENDILIARMPTPIGRGWLVTKMPWRMVTAVDVAIIKPNPKKAGALLLTYFINSAQTLKTCEGLAAGATRPRITRKNLVSLPFLLPPKRLQAEFSDVAAPIHALKLTLSRQNVRLREARDILLPKLMSGDIEA